MSTQEQGKSHTPKPEIRPILEPKNRGRDPLTADKKTGWVEHGKDELLHYFWPKRGLGGGDPTYDDHVRRTRRNKGLAIGGAIAVGVLALGGGIFAACHESDKAPNVTTPNTGAATGTPAPRPENIPALVPIENNAALEKIIYPEQRFGDLSDPWSRLASSWESIENGYGWVLKNPPHGKVARVNLNGAVVEGWIESKDSAGNTIPIVILAGPQQKQLDLRGGTFRVSNNPTKLLQEIKPKLIANEKVQQPNAVFLEACISPDLSSFGWVNTISLGDPAKFVENHAGDTYSADIRNWIFGLEGGNLAVLKAPGDGSITRIRLSGNEVAESYFDSPNGRIHPAMSFVTDSSLGYAVGRGFSIRDFVDKKGFDQLVRQHLERERIEQPGIVTLAFGVCPIVEPPCIPCMKPTTPTPTPEVVAPCAWPESREEAALAFGVPGDEYSTNPQNWAYVSDEKAWFMRRDTANDRRVKVGTCNIARFDKFVTINKIDPYQTTVVNGENGPYVLEVRSIKIYNEVGAAAANKLYNKELKENPFNLMQTLTMGFIPVLDKPNQ